MGSRPPSCGSGRWAAIRGDGLPPTDPVRLRRHVEYWAGPCDPRTADNPAGLRCAADYAVRVFTESGAAVEEQEFAALGESYRNVVARFGPPGIGLTVVGAHYDSFGLFGENPGADDNASGVAGLLELARLLGERPPPGEVEVVAYAKRGAAVLRHSAHGQRRPGARTRLR